MKLYNALTREEMHVGDDVRTFRGEHAVLVSFIEPGPRQTGRVTVVLRDKLCEFYPSVIGAEFA